jgi:hypothetical protein
MQDARDVFLALSSRLGALTGGTHGTPAETVPDAPAATSPQAASPDLAGSAPACGSAAPTPDDGASAQCEAAAATAGSDQPAAPPGAPPPADLSLIDIGTNTTRAPHGSRVGPRQTRRWSCCCSGRRFAAGRFAAGRFAARRCAARRSAFPQPTISFHGRNIVGCPPRLLCYAACAGPPALPGAPNRARPVARHARGRRMAVPRYLIPAA